MTAQGMMGDPPFQRADPNTTLSGPSLTVDPADRVFVAGGEARGHGRLGMVIVALLGVAVLGALFFWSQRGAQEAALAPLPTPAVSPTNAVTSVPPAAPVASPPAATATPAPATSTAAPAAPAASQSVNQAVTAPAAAQPAAPSAKEAAPQAAEKAAPAKTEKPKAAAAPAAATTEKKKKKAADATSAATKPKPAAPKPAATDASDENFSTLLKSLTNEEDGAQPAAAPPAQPAPVQEPAAPTPAPKACGPLPTSTAPSTPGSQLFTP